MGTWYRAAAAAGAVLALVAAAAVAPPSASAGQNARDRGHTFAVIGDIPYGDAQIGRFPAVVRQINADPAVQWVDHLGDIKNGSSRCDTSYFEMIKTDFDCLRRSLGVHHR